MFRIALDGDPLDYPLTVSFVMSGLADEGTDYTLSHSGQVTIPAGERFIDIVLTPIDDHEDEGGGENADLDIIDDDHYDTHKYLYWDSIFIADDDPRPAELTTPDDNSGDMEPEDPCGCGPGGIEPDPVKGSATVFTGGNGQVDCTAPDLALNTGTNPHPVVSVEWALPAEPGVSPAAPPPTVVATATLGGVTADPVHYGTDGFAAGDRVRIALQTDAGALPTGRHPYSIELKTLDVNGDPIPGQTQTFHGHTTVFNRTEAAGTSTVSYGLGWWMTSLDRLVEGAGGVALVRANATAGWFAHTGGVSYGSPDGSRTELSAQAGGWTLQHPDGGTSTFDGAGLLTDRTDRNGNATTYAYLDADGDGIADELEAVTDPFGRVAGYAYDGNGRLQTRTDFFGRVTTYAYDGNGRLQSVTQPDPDGAGPGLSPVTTYGYDPSTGQLVTITDAEGGVTTLTYENRLLRAIERPGRGAAEQYVPVNAQGLAPPGTGTAANPAPLAPASGGRATLTDATGRTTTVHYDRLGNPTRIIDPTGHITRIERNADGQPTRLITPDPDGPEGPLGPAVTNYAYDTRGNLSSMTLPDGGTRSWTYAPHRSWVTSFTDEEDRTTTFANSATGNPLTTTDPLDRVTTYTYGDIIGPIGTVKGLLSAVTLPDPDGTPAGQGPPTTTYAYDSLGRLTTITGPGNDSVTLAYDAQENLQSLTDELDRTTTFTYDALGRQTGTILPDPIDPAAVVTDPAVAIAYRRDGRVASATDALGRTTTYGYDLGGRLSSITLPHPGGPGALDPTSFAHDAADRLIAETDPLGRVTTYGYDGAGRLETVTRPDPDGPGGQAAPVTAYTYDHRGRLIAETDPLGRVTAFAYDPRDRLVALTRPDPDGLGGQDAPTTTYTYTPSGRLRTVTGPDPDGLGGQDAPTTTYAYDLADRLTTVTGPDPDGPGGQDAPTTTYTYDRLGRRTAVTDPLNRVTTFAYDALDRLTTITAPDPDGPGPLASPVTGYGYDAVGNLRTTTDPLNRVTTFAYDALDRLTTITAPDPDGPGPLASPVTGYGYDAVGNRTTVTDPLGKVTTTAYDALDRATTVTDPRGGQTAMAYDAVGKTVSVTDPLGNRTTFAYDALDRVTTVTDPLGAETAYAYDAAGQLTSETDRVGRRRTFTHDGLGRRVAERWLDAAGGTLRTISHTYDAADQLTAIADPDASLAFDYDGLGRPITATTSGTAPGQPSLTLTSTYDDVGNRTRLADDLAGSGWDGAGVTTYAYDALDRMTTIARSLGSHAGPRVELGYDAAGRLTSLARTLGGSGTAVESDFAYDALHRLTTLTHEVAGGPPLASYAYGYDPAGRLAVESNAEGVATYTYDDTGQLTAVDRPAGQADEAYTYDLGGNRTAGAGRSATQVVDDGGVGWSSVGTWATGGLPGAYGGGYRANSAGSGADAASWTFSVTPGATYRVLATWIPDDNRAGDAPFTLSDGVSATTVHVDQRLAPDDSWAGGSAWEDLLGSFTPAGSSLTVTLTDDADGYVIADAVRIEEVAPPPRVQVVDDGGSGWSDSPAGSWSASTGVPGYYGVGYHHDNAGGADHADYAFAVTPGVTYRISATWTAGGNRAPDAPYTIIDDGVALMPVAEDQRSAPDDFQAEGTWWEVLDEGVVASGSSLVVRLGSVASGAVIADAVRIEEVAPPPRDRVVDDGGVGWSSVGTWATGGLPGAYGGGYRANSAGSGADAASWTFSGLPDGTYEVAATWIPAANRAGDAPFTISGGASATTVHVDQRLAPDDLRFGGVGWEVLAVVAVAGGTIDVTLTDDADGYVIADAVRITPVLPANRLDRLGDVVYRHDAEGNRSYEYDLITGATTRYAYDHRNRLTGVVRTDASGAETARVSYSYDALDRRIRVQADADGAGPGAPATTWTVYDGAHAYADFDGSGTLQTRYLHGPAVDMLLARTSAAGTTAWYLTDRLGSVRDLANTSGTVINHVAYDGFGKVLSESNPAHGDRFKFTGREQDAVTGLQYNRARYYDAAIGRWTQEDPIGFAAGDPNLYRYVGNGPTNYTDPSGLDKMEAVGWAGDRVALAYIEESWIGFGIWEGAPELIGLFDPNTGLVERNGQFVTIKALRKAFDRGDIDSGRIDPWFADAALGIAQISEQQCKAMALSTRDGAHRPGYYERSIREQDTIGFLAEFGISWTAGGADFASMSHAAALGVVRNGDRLFVLPSNQVVSRFDTVTLAPKTVKDFPGVGTKASQKQLRHIKGRTEYRGGGYFDNAADAQSVLDAFHSGDAMIIGTTSQGFPVVRYGGVKGTNVNVGSGFPNQPTNVFIIKGTASPSVVPANPNWGG